MDIRVPLNNTLRSGSENYMTNLNSFVAFNEAHDPKNLIQKYFIPIIKDKIILDIGCGYGKYIPLFAPYCKKYVGIDISGEEVKIARKNKFDNVRIYHCSADKMPFKDLSFDIVLSIYGAISVVKPLTKKAKILKEVQRVLKHKGYFYLVTDAFTGEWVKMKSRTKSRWGFNWLLDNGFEIETKIKTCFEFKSKEEAKSVLHSLFGRKLSVFVKKKMIKQHVVVLSINKWVDNPKIIYKNFKITPTLRK